MSEKCYRVSLTRNLYQNGSVLVLAPNPEAAIAEVQLRLNHDTLQPELVVWENPPAVEAGTLTLLEDEAEPVPLDQRCSDKECPLCMVKLRASPEIIREYTSEAGEDGQA